MPKLQPGRQTSYVYSTLFNNSLSRLSSVHDVIPPANCKIPQIFLSLHDFAYRVQAYVVYRLPGTTVVRSGKTPP
jgi:hypothetical protein